MHFYGEILGLQKKYEFSDYAGFDCGGVELGLKTWGEKESPRKGEPCIDLLVDNVDQFFTKLQAKGVAFTKEPEDTLWGAKIAVFADPDGNLLQITQVDWGSYFVACAPR